MWASAELIQDLCSLILLRQVFNAYGSGSFSSKALCCLACYYNHLIDCQAHHHLVKSPINPNHLVWHLRCFTVQTLVFIPFLRLLTRQASSPLGCGLSDYLSPECSLLLSFWPQFRDYLGDFFFLWLSGAVPQTFLEPRAEPDKNGRVQ